MNGLQEPSMKYHGNNSLTYRGKLMRRSGHDGKIKKFTKGQISRGDRSSQGNESVKQRRSKDSFVLHVSDHSLNAIHYSVGGFFFMDKTYVENPKTPTTMAAAVTLSMTVAGC